MGQINTLRKEVRALTKQLGERNTQIEQAAVADAKREQELLHLRTENAKIKETLDKASDFIAAAKRRIEGLNEANYRLLMLLGKEIEMHNATDEVTFEEKGFIEQPTTVVGPMRVSREALESVLARFLANAQTSAAENGVAKNGEQRAN